MSKGDKSALKWVRGRLMEDDSAFYQAAASILNRQVLTYVIPAVLKPNPIKSELWLT